MWEGEEGKKGEGIVMGKRGMKRKEVEVEGRRGREREENGNKGEEVEGRKIGTGPLIG